MTPTPRTIRRLGAVGAALAVIFTARPPAGARAEPADLVAQGRQALEAQAIEDELRKP